MLLRDQGGSVDGIHHAGAASGLNHRLRGEG
jgi:hypothetical protein